MRRSVCPDEMARTALLRSRSEQWIFAGPDVILGEFHCPPERPQWNVPNVIGEWPLITFPATSCWIEQAGRDPVVADRATSIFYNPFTEYRRGLLDPLGDHCTYLVPRPALLAEAASVWVPAVGPREVRFDWTTGPIDHRTYLLQHAVRCHVVSEETPDPLYATESLYRLLARILGNALRLHRDPDRRAEPTGRAERAHAEVVEATKAVVAVRFADRLTLEELARAVYVSPFHLARLFRRRTGTTIHGHRTRIRLHAALDRMDEYGGDLAEVASSLGFSDHSHLTNAFRRAFGFPPSALRRAKRSTLRQMRTILQA